MKIPRVIVYVGVVTGVCGLRLNAAGTEINVAIQSTRNTWDRDTFTLNVYGPNVNTFLANTNLGSVKHLFVRDHTFKDIPAWGSLGNLETLDLSHTDVRTFLRCLIWSHWRRLICLVGR
jgi:hypothetical protein